MRELSLHVLDLVQNSIEAGASVVALSIVEDKERDILVIRVRDNGRGMDEKQCRDVVDPFVTSRRTRRVGLGLPLIEMYTKRCAGHLIIDSVPGCGTVVEASYQYSHLDRPPLGNMVETIKSIIIANPNLEFSYSHTVDQLNFTIATNEITEILGDISLSNPEVISWLTEYLSSHLVQLQS